MTLTEERLRSALHAWADAVPAAPITAAELTQLRPDGRRRPERRSRRQVVVPVAAAAAVVALAVAVVLGLPARTLRPGSLPEAGKPTAVPSPDISRLQPPPTSPLAKVGPSSYFYWSGGSTCVVSLQPSGESQFCSGTHPIDATKPIIDIAGMASSGSTAVNLTGVLVNHEVARVVAVLYDVSRREVPLQRDTAHDTSVGVLLGVGYEDVASLQAYDISGALLSTVSPAQFDAELTGTASSVSLRPVLTTWPGICDGHTAPSGALLTTDKNTCFALAAPIGSALTGATATVVGDGPHTASLALTLTAAAAGAVRGPSPIALVENGFVVATTSPCAAHVGTTCTGAPLSFSGLDRTLAAAVAKAINK